MIRIVFLLLLLLLAYVALRKLHKAPPAVKARWRRYALIAGALAALIFISMTGGLGGLFAVLGLAAAFLLRLLPPLLHNAPYLQQIWAAWQRSQQGRAEQQTPRHGAGTMTKEHAYNVLGLPAGASDKDIIEAHRRLMQKIHPDRGGSDYLASQINLAKKTLLGR